MKYDISLIYNRIYLILNIAVQKIKVKKLVLNLPFLQIKPHLNTHLYQHMQQNIDISHDVVALVVLEIFHKL